MKKNEFKKILKPLIREAVKEVLFEPGVLSKVIAEVAQGIQGAPLVERKEAPSALQTDQLDEEAKLYEEKRQERIRRLNESVGLKTSVFEGISDIQDAPSSSPLSGVKSGDSGVDITAIAKLAGGSKKWKTLVGKQNANKR
tara:strand:+ start:1194 stop:1616 length:423 start_codon:yes stop_codon:yes gene_type:complete